MRTTRPWMGIAAVPALAACAAGPDYHAPPASTLGVPARYHGAAVAPALSSFDLAQWWQQFNDPVLNDVVTQATERNLDLQVAVARLRQAREAVVQARAASLPEITASVGAGRTFNSGTKSSGDYNIGGDASWEADLFGGIARGVEAARADEQAAGLDLAAVRISIIGEVATNYIQARLAQQQLQNARDTLTIADDNLDIAQWRVRAGLVSSLDSEQARSSRAQTAATIPPLERSFAAAAYRLGVLTGQAPAALVDLLSRPQPIPAGPTEVAVGIPADTLRQRPDVRSAERALAAATARIGVAQAQLYPALRITGNIGSSALTPGRLFDAITGSLFAGLTQTIFDGGRLHSQLRAQRAVAEGAYATYRQAVLTALEDVENGLAALQSARARHTQFLIAFDAANNSAILARNQYRAGLTDFQTLLDSERSLVSARDGMSSSLSDEALAVVQLYRALGGGWESLANPAAAASHSEGRS